MPCAHSTWTLASSVPLLCHCWVELKDCDQCGLPHLNGSLRDHCKSCRSPIWGCVPASLALFLTSWECRVQPLAMWEHLRASADGQCSELGSYIPCTSSRPRGCSSVQFSCSLVSDSLRPHGLQHARLPCPSPTPRACLNSCPLSRWCHPTISSSVVPFSSHLQSFPDQGLFQWVSSSHQMAKSIGTSASTSVLPMNIQDWFPLGWAGLIYLHLASNMFCFFFPISFLIFTKGNSVFSLPRLSGFSG